MAFKVKLILVVTVVISHIGLASDESPETKTATYDELKTLLGGKNPVNVIKKLKRLCGDKDPVVEYQRNKELVDNYIDPFIKEASSRVLGEVIKECRQIEGLASNESPETEIAAYEELKTLPGGENPVNLVKELKQLFGDKDPVVEIKKLKVLSGDKDFMVEFQKNKELVDNLIDPVE